MLRRWGDGLSHDHREEVRAAGRAILLLSDEIESLHVELWHARDRGEAQPEPDESGRAALPQPAANETVGKALRDRLSAFRFSNSE